MTLSDLATELAAAWVAEQHPSVPSNKEEFVYFCLGVCPAKLYSLLMGANEHLDWVLATASMKVERYRAFERNLGAIVEDDGA